MSIDSAELLDIASLLRRYQGRIQEAHEHRDHTTIYALGHTICDHTAERLEAIVARVAGKIEIREAAE